MKILNINADVNLCKKVLDFKDFIFKIIGHQNTRKIEELQMLPYNHYDNNSELPQVRMFEIFEYANVANLIHTIPIFLYNKRPEKRNEEPYSQDPLGAYITSPSKEPRIELYVDEIENNGKDDFMQLFTLILLHELGHAALDINNCSLYATPFDKYTYLNQEDIEKEEGMANAIAYRIIKEAKNSSFENYANSFISDQGDGYNQGIEYEKCLENNITEHIRWKIETIEAINKK